MPPTTLPQSAAEAYTDLVPLWFAGTLAQDLLAFCEQLKPNFDGATVGDQPVLNWVAVIEAYATQIGAQTLSPFPIPGYNPITVDQVSLAAGYVYRICWMARYFEVATFITAGQATAIIDAYNDNIAPP